MMHLELMHIVSSTLDVPYDNYSNGSKLRLARDMRTIAAMLMRSTCSTKVTDIQEMYKLKNHTTIIKNCQQGYRRLRRNKGAFPAKYNMCVAAIN